MNDPVLSIVSEVTPDVLSSCARIDELFTQFDVDEIGITMDLSLPSVYYTEKKLGISIKIVKSLYHYYLSKFYDIVRCTNRHDAILSIAACSEINSITRGLLLIKGDFQMAYNMRKKLLVLGHIGVDTEIHLSRVIFTKTPKSPSGWEHRRWCLSRQMRIAERTNLSLAEIETEKEICRCMAELYPKNYYAWMHRKFLLSHMAGSQVSDELEFVCDWLLSHASDHCAANHFTQVLLYLLNNPDSIQHFMNRFFDRTDSLRSHHIQKHLVTAKCSKLSIQLIRDRPGYETMWYLHRSIFSIRLWLIQGQLKDDQVEALRNHVPECEDANDWEHLYLLIISLRRREFEAFSTSISIVDFNLEERIAIIAKRKISELSCCLCRYLTSEVVFIVNILRIPSLWNADKQRHFAQCYAAHIFFKILSLWRGKYCVRSSEQGPWSVEYYCVSMLDEIQKCV